jgi:hypothetical protein
MKHLRLGNKSKVESVIQKYGIDFTCDNGVSGLMMALQYGQTELAIDLINKGASLTCTNNASRLPADYLLASYIKNKRSNQKQVQLAGEQTLIRCWNRVCPPIIEYEYNKRHFRISSHSMLLSLILLMRNTADTQLSKAKIHFQTGQDEFITDAFNMSELEQFAPMIPDEILPSYRKNVPVLTVSWHYMNGINSRHIVRLLFSASNGDDTS